MSFMARLGRLATRLASAAVLGGLLAGIPAGLVTQIGSPIPASLPTSLADIETLLTTPFTDEVLIQLLSVALWILWASFAASVTAEILAGLHGARMPRLPAIAPIQTVAAWLLSGITAGVVATTTLTPAVTASPVANPPPAAVAVVQPEQQPPTDSSGPSSSNGLHRWRQWSDTDQMRLVAAEATQPDQALVHEVADGDWMWHIAGRYLGDEQRYPEIAALNPEVADRYSDFPDHIQPGDSLRLPEDARDRGERRHATGEAVTVSPPVEEEQPPAHPDPAEADEHDDGAARQPELEPAEPTLAPTAPTPAPSIPAETAPDPAPGTGAQGEPDADPQPEQPSEVGVVLPSGAWVSLGLAALIATAATVLRLHQRRRTRLATRPIPTGTSPARTPVPESLTIADTAGATTLEFEAGDKLPAGVVPAPLPTRAPVGVDPAGAPVGLFDLPGPVVAVDGEGAAAVLRGFLAAAVSTGVAEHMGVQPRMVIPSGLLDSLLPPDVAPVGLDPEQVTFDEERLVVTPDAGAAVTRAEVEMVHRRRILDSTDAESIPQLCEQDEQPEHLPPYVLVIDAVPQYLPRIRGLAAHRDALDLHVVVLGPVDGMPSHLVDVDGTVTAIGAANEAAADAARVARLSALAPQDLVDVLELVRQVTPRPEAGSDVDLDEPPAPATVSTTVPVPTPDGDRPPPVRLSVLGEVAMFTEAGQVTEGVRTGSLAVLALLAAHPDGYSMGDIAATLHAGDDMSAARHRVRTDMSTLRAALRKATGLDERARFIAYDERSRRYTIEANLVEVDLWRMLTAIQTANDSADDQVCLAALRHAADLYAADFATSLGQAWTIGYATTIRATVVSVYARIAEICEADQPDDAVAALESGIEIDPVNEELYQRLMRIHGRTGRADQVRATMRLLDNRLAEIGHAEPSEATRRVAARQMAGRGRGGPPPGPALAAHAT